MWPLRKRLFDLCRTLRPAIVHSRNISGLDAVYPAYLAGVRAYIRVGSEDDLTRSNGLLKRLREGDSVAQIISSLSEFASLPTARIDEAPMDV